MEVKGHQENSLDGVSFIQKADGQHEPNIGTTKQVIGFNSQSKFSSNALSGFNVQTNSTVSIISANDISGIDSCSPAQRANIIQYGNGMIQHGYKESYALNVCNDMVKLYQSGIEEIIPEEFASYEDDSCLDDNDKRRQIKQKLYSVMCENEGNYSFVTDYLLAQNSSSWSKKSKTFKDFCICQKSHVENGQSYLGYKRKFVLDESGEKVYFSEKKPKKIFDKLHTLESFQHRFSVMPDEEKKQIYKNNDNVSGI